MDYDTEDAAPGPDTLPAGLYDALSQRRSARGPGRVRPAHRRRGTRPVRPGTQLTAPSGQAGKEQDMPLNDQVSDGISRILERMTPEERAEFMAGAETNPDTEA